MIQLRFIVVIIALVSQTSAFRANFYNLGRNLQRIQLANKLNEVMIDGNLTPISNGVFVKVKDVQSTTSGGIFIPDNAKERPHEGEVIATGPGRVHPDTGAQLDMSVKVGDRVVYGKYDGAEMKYNDLPHQLIKDDDVLLTYTGPHLTLQNVECVKDQVLIKLPPKEEKTSSGVIINTPGNKEKRPENGQVVKIGPGRQAANGQYMPMQVKPGDFVKFRDYAGSEVKIDGQDYLVVRCYDILAKW